MFLVYLIPNDHVLMYYHFDPCVISYFSYFCIFTLLVWLYKLPHNFVTLTLIFQHTAFHFVQVFSLLSPLSLTFLATKHSSEDDNSEDVWLDLFLLEVEGCWGLDLQAAGGSPVFHAAGFVILVPKISTLSLKLFDVLSLANTWKAFRV